MQNFFWENISIKDWKSISFQLNKSIHYINYNQNRLNSITNNIQIFKNNCLLRMKETFLLKGKNEKVKHFQIELISQLKLYIMKNKSQQLLQFRVR